MYIKNKASKTWNFELDEHFKHALAVAEGQKLPTYCIQFQNIEAIALFVQYGTVIKEHFFFFFQKTSLLCREQFLYIFLKLKGTTINRLCPANSNTIIV